MFKNFSKIFIICSMIVLTGVKTYAADWRSTQNTIGNLIYVDADSIQQKGDKIFYKVKYYENKIKKESQLIILSEDGVPFVVGDPVAFKNMYFMANLKDVNEKVLAYVDKNNIPQVDDDSDYNFVDINREPYAKNVIQKVKNNLKYKFKYRNSSARAMVKINKQGEVKKVHIYESSGNQKLNVALVNAIEKAGPFDPLPESYNKTYALLWIDVNYGKDKSVILLNSALSLGKMILR